jgi:hypothetical protein
MGVEYQHYVIPQEPGFRPSAERIASFVRALLADQWIVGPDDPAFQKRLANGCFTKGTHVGAARKTGAFVELEAKEPAPRAITAEWLRERKRAIKLVWPTEMAFETGARFPLSRAPYVREWVYFAIELHWSRYFLQCSGENTRCAAITCTCGASLELEKAGPFFGAYQTRCGACGVPLQPSRFVMTHDDSWSGRRTRMEGGGLHRFALVVNCGKSVPEDGAPVVLEPGLMQLLTGHFGRAFRDVGLVC